MTKRANAWSRNAVPAITSAPPTIWTASAGSWICQPVSSQGISPATTPGTRTRKASVPAAAGALRDRRRLSCKPGDQLGEPLGLILRDEGVGVVDLLQGRAVDGVRKPLREGELEEAILDRPGEHRRAVERAQPLGSLERVLRVDALQDLGHVPPDALVRQVRVHPLSGRGTGEVALDEPAVRVRQTAERRKAHPGHHRRQAT